MSEKLYEGMFLLNSSKYASDPEGVTNHVLEILEKAGAEVVAHRPWQESTLAYEIEGHRKGWYYLTCFKTPADNHDANQLIARSCKLSELVIRHLVIRHPAVIFDAMVSAMSSSAEEEPEDDGADTNDALEASDDTADSGAEEAGAEKDREVSSEA